MNDSETAARDRPMPLRDLATELTIAAHPVAARHGLGALWLWVDLGIDLWTVLQRKVTSLGRTLAGPRWPGEFEVWRQLLLAELTDAAYRTTLRYGAQSSSLELEMDLYQAFCLVLDDIGRETLLCHMLEVGSDRGIMSAQSG
jgi:hypothetical protein